MQSYTFIISGHVQGVYYRRSVQSNAVQLNFSGYVKNLPDGTVEAAVTCKKERLNDFITLLRHGSSKSRVDAIEQSDSDTVYNGKFEVR